MEEGYKALNWVGKSRSGGVAESYRRACVFSLPRGRIDRMRVKSFRKSSHDAMMKKSSGFWGLKTVKH